MLMESGSDMLTIGLTGGIGSGKTAVSDAFSRRGAAVIDTDIIAREIVRPNRPALAAIACEFGPDCLDARGNLDRAFVRRTVFAEPALRKRLEAILHPRIRQAVKDRLTAMEVPYCLVVIPLLTETGMDDLVQRILVVDVAEAVQIERVKARDGVNEQQARAILAAQASRAQRLALADDVIENTGSLSELDSKVAKLHDKYLALGAIQTGAGNQDSVPP